MDQVTTEPRTNKSWRIVIVIGLWVATVPLSRALESTTKHVLGPDGSNAAGDILISLAAFLGADMLFPAKKPMRPLARVGMVLTFALVMAIIKWGANRLFH